MRDSRTLENPKQDDETVNRNCNTTETHTANSRVDHESHENIENPTHRSDALDECFWQISK